MSKRLNEDLGSMTYDNLIVSAHPTADVMQVSIKAEEKETVYKRGTVLARGTDGKMTIMAEGGKANCILTDDVTVGTDGVEAIAYRTGHFAGNMLTVKDGYALTADDKEELRKCGILLSDAV